MVPLDGGEKPMSVIRGLASSDDRETRRQAYHAELAAWERVSIPLCAAMNSIKHESNVLAERRGWGDVLNVALYNNHIDQATLDAMMTAARAAFPDFRRYLRAKARVVSGENTLAWYDLFAPLGASTTDLVLARGRELHRDAVWGLQRQAQRIRDARLSRKMDRCRTASRQARRRVLYASAARRVAHYAELQVGLRQRRNAGA